MSPTRLFLALFLSGCGYRFAVDVRSEAHKQTLEEVLPPFQGAVVVMWWC